MEMAYVRWGWCLLQTRQRPFSIRESAVTASRKYTSRRSSSRFMVMKWIQMGNSNQLKRRFRPRTCLIWRRMPHSPTPAMDETRRSLETINRGLTLTVVYHPSTQEICSKPPYITTSSRWASSISTWWVWRPRWIRWTNADILFRRSSRCQWWTWWFHAATLKWKLCIVRRNSSWKNGQPPSFC